MEGRNFDPHISSDIENAVIINQTAAKLLGWDSPIGKNIQIDRKEGICTIIGVVKDFNIESLKRTIRPYVFYFMPEHYYKLNLKIKPDDVEGTMAFIQRKWSEFAPKEEIFTYAFLDQTFKALYSEENRIGKIIRLTTILTFVIAGLGLFGLSAFTVERRYKEIGIRKVLGASISSVIVMLSKGITHCVLLANLIALPVAYFVMNRWLQNFSYRASLNVWIFILSGLTALVIALLTVSYQTIKAARANPVESLKYE